MLTKNQDTTFKILSFLFALVGGMQRGGGIVGLAINLLLGTLFGYAIYRFLWWLFNKIKPIQVGQSTTLRMWLILLYPFELSFALMVILWIATANSQLQGVIRITFVIGLLILGAGWFFRKRNNTLYYNKALSYYQQLADLSGYPYRSAIYHIVENCQKALETNKRDGDSLVLLANAYLLAALEVRHKELDYQSMVFRGARVINYFSTNKFNCNPDSLKNSLLIYDKLAEMTGEILNKQTNDAMQHIALLPPGQLQDALRDRLSLGMAILGDEFKALLLLNHLPKKHID